MRGSLVADVWLADCTTLLEHQRQLYPRLPEAEDMHAAKRGDAGRLCRTWWPVTVEGQRNDRVKAEGQINLRSPG